MPKAQKVRISKAVTHPNSRKALQLARHSKRDQKKQEKTRQKATKLDALLNKFLWFKENCEEEKLVFSLREVHELIERYINRFKEELEQTEIIQTIPHRSKDQHASRQHAIKAVMDHEQLIFTTSGFDAPDLLTTKAVKSLRSWNGEAKSIPNLPVRKYINESAKK